jgi:uncharacterized protein with PQ loop repeat
MSSSASSVNSFFSIFQAVKTINEKNVKSIAITGASGVLGKELKSYYENKGIKVKEYIIIIICFPAHIKLLKCKDNSNFNNIKN